MNQIEIGKRLVELCAKGEYRTAIEELYADDCTHVEPIEMPGCPKVTTGKDNILKATDEWVASNEVHESSFVGPFPKDDQFVCMMMSDLTMQAGPMAGTRMKLEEACLYTVKDGKITRGEFFYATDFLGA